MNIVMNNRCGKVPRRRGNVSRMRWIGTSLQGFIFFHIDLKIFLQFSLDKLLWTKSFHSLPGCSCSIGTLWRDHGTGRKPFRIQIVAKQVLAFKSRYNLGRLSQRTILSKPQRCVRACSFQDKDHLFMFRTDENKPFAIDRQKPKGAGFYSEDLSYKEFKVCRL